MLIQFTFRNFRSFPNETTLSMVAEKLKSQDKTLDENNVFAVDDKLSLLTSAAIYGPNASGKSNVLKALEFMRSIALQPVHVPGVESLGIEGVELFQLNTQSMASPALFEVHLLGDGARYQYGFELTPDHIVSEWLYYYANVHSNRRTLVFDRNADEVEFGSSVRGGKETLTALEPNGLFLVVMAQHKNKHAQNVIQWFRRIRAVSDLNDPRPELFTQRRILDGQSAEEVKQFVRRFDIGIDDINVTNALTEVDVNDLQFPRGMPEDMQNAIKLLLHQPNTELIKIITQHTRYDPDGKSNSIVEFDFERQESEGTKKLFALAGLIVEALSTGRLLVVDELDARLHTRLTREIVGLFNDRHANPKHAQLIFITHDTNLLDNRLLRRDQIWFVEKDTRGASQLYSLAEFKGVRNDKDFERGYMQGQYGALPFAHAIREAVIGSYDVTKKE